MKKLKNKVQENKQQIYAAMNEINKELEKVREMLELNAFIKHIANGGE